MIAAAPLPINVTTVLHPLHGLPVLDIARFQLHSSANVLKGRNLIANAVMGEGVEIIPFSRTLGALYLG
jgi:hypothetical protein